MDAGKQQQKSVGRPFPKGASGNPSGRPKGSVNITSRIKRYLRDNPEKADALVEAMVLQALEGNSAIFKELLNRVDGATPQRIDVNQLSDAQVLGALALMQDSEDED